MKSLLPKHVFCYLLSSMLPASICLAADSTEASRSTPEHKAAAIQAAKKDSEERRLLISRLREEDFAEDSVMRTVEDLFKKGTAGERRACVISVTGLKAGPRRARLLDALVASLDSVHEAENSSRLVYYGDLLRPISESSVLFRVAISQLCEMDDLGIHDLERLTPTGTGRARDCLLIVRGVKRDTRVKGELALIAEHSSDWGLRQKAVRAFSRIGTEGDVTLLRRIAETDPFCIVLSEGQRIAAASVAPEGAAVPAEFYPVRKAAQIVLSELKR